MKYLYLHGLGQNADSWNKVTSATEVSENSACLDLAEMVKGKVATYSALYSAFSEMCNAENEDIILCGLSLGSVLALNYAIDYPKKVKALVLIAAQYKMPARLLKLHQRILDEHNSPIKIIAKTKPRAIEILDDMFNLTRREMVHVPIIGQVAAGEPILAQENIEDYWPVPADRMPNKQTFFLKVKGESMINAGIFDGDMVIVEQQPTADNGDIVVAMIEDSATVKRFYKEDGYYRLQPENDTMDPIIVSEVSIIGKVVGLYRSMK